MSNSSAICTPEVTILALPDEMFRKIFVFLDPTNILLTASRTCRQFTAIASNDSFWLVVYRESHAISFHESVFSSLTKKQIQQCYVVSNKRMTSNREWFVEGEGERNKFICPTSVLPSRDDALMSRSREYRACLSSTTDRVYMEMTENVLLPSEKFAKDDWRQIVSGNPRYIYHRDESLMDAKNELFRIHNWWSSTPSQQNSPDDINEVLIFAAKETAIITELATKPMIELKAHNIVFHEDNLNVYSWPRISMKIYLLPQSDTSKNNIPLFIRRQMSHTEFDVRSRGNRHLNQRPIIDAVLKNHEPTYESPVMDAKSTDGSWQYYKVPDGVVGNLVMFALWGKMYEQFSNSGYYVCVERVAARGVPLVMS
mmetsp:Transcript_59502/g.70911  ORF Transcript_59502/g.70911 Transcript_59502/m.70911 type:complete len:370 (-) Transcript_59502:23-1132(-)|eukprot:CAMPEP_0172505622 /NCGR_PEP_ID=MMETSP1066-20121228/187786_1 /TAXON_ID=671091 /ORGANISM="Coscinodiscus wailesii, Strain CCMP2513" /LENGTH=369 /DNA_ID=CAMNT_0013282307 /DNA_START=130 /DNA_END=1239 /DNA_ORIENTATION=-